MKENLIHYRTSVCNINYHMVWSVKYRRKILTGEVEAYLKELVRQIADDKGFTVQLFECGECDHQKYPEWNYLLTKKKCELLKKTSVVNLKLINKAEPMGKYLFAVSDQVLKDLIRRFKEWQNENPDPLYEEIKDII